MVCAETCYQGNAKRYSLYSQAGSPFFSRTDFGITCGADESNNDMVPYEQLSIDQQKAAWFMDGRQFQWKNSTLFGILWH